MRVLILGGTGATGLLLIREALMHKHQVVVYARSPQKLPDDISDNDQVVVVKGELDDIRALSEAMKGVYAVISTLGPSSKHPSGTPLAHAYSSLIKIMHTYDVKRLIALGTASIKDPNDKFSYKWAALIKGVATLAPNAYKDIVAIGETIRTEGEELAWTIVRVGILTNSDSRDVVAGYTGDGKTTIWLPRLGFAVFAIEEVEKDEWVKKAPLISAL